MDKNIKLSILTKSDLVLRDIDLLKQFKEIEIGLTINSFEDNLKEIFEPNSPTNEQRIKALKTLKENGITTYAFISPIIPGLTNIEEIIKNTKDYADFYWFEMINIRAAGKEFTELIKTKFPESYTILNDKESLKEFIKGLEKTIKYSGITTKDIEIH
jgi:DNA repair photolyase